MMHLFHKLNSLRLLIMLTVLLRIGSSTAWADTTFQRVTSTSDLVVGDRYIIVSETNSVAMGTLKSGKGQGIGVSITSNTITIDETTSGIDVFTLGGSAGNYTLRGSKSYKYLGWSTGTDFQTSNSLPSSAAEKKKYQWNITFSSNNATIANVSDNNRLIKGYDSSKDFRAYSTSDGSAVQLYKKIAATPTESVTVGAAGYTTYTTVNSVSFPDGVIGYIVTATDNDKSTATLTRKASVPANTPIVIKASANTYELPIVATPEDVTGNLLLASDGSVKGDEEGTIYALGIGKTGENEGQVGFYLVNDGQTVPAGKAYMTIPAAGGSTKGFTFDFDGLATGINTVQGSGFKVQDSKIFNLAGQRVDGSRFKVNGSGLKTGIYIVNGKKVLVK